VNKGLSRSRNERRYNTLADIYRMLMLFHRCLLSWSRHPPRCLDAQESAVGHLQRWEDQQQQDAHSRVN